MTDSPHYQNSETNDSAPQIILASASPRRRQLLEILKIPHRVAVADVNERALSATSPREFALKAALLKAGALDNILPIGTIVVAADTVVALGGKIYFKPDDAADAARMLRELSAHTHKVITGVAVREVGRATLLDAATTEVHIKPLTDAEIEMYVATGEPLDKAGAYGIQGHGGKLVEHISGDYFNVVGLPVDNVIDMLARHVDVTRCRAARRNLTPESFREYLK